MINKPLKKAFGFLALAALGACGPLPQGGYAPSQPYGQPTYTPPPYGQAPYGQPGWQPPPSPFAGNWSGEGRGTNGNCSTGGESLTIDGEMASMNVEHSPKVELSGSVDPWGRVRMVGQERGRKGDTVYFEGHIMGNRLVGRLNGGTCDKSFLLGR